VSCTFLKPFSCCFCPDCFRRNISKILDGNEDIKIAISWCPGHAGIVGNVRADELAKSGSSQPPLNPDYKSQAYIAALHKRELLEAWKFKWSNTPNLPNSGFQLANRLPPSLKPTKRFSTSDRRTFSRLIQCRTGHAHLGDYSKKFVPTEETSCKCGKPTRTREHVKKERQFFARQKLTLGHGRNARTSSLMGTIKGIRKLIKFTKHSSAFEKEYTEKFEKEREKERIEREGLDYFLNT